MTSIVTQTATWARAFAVLAGGLATAACGSGGLSEQTLAAPVYSIEGKHIQLEDGVTESEDGTIHLLTAVSGDLNGDAVDDQAAILVLNSRGSGVFYYLNVLLNDGRGTSGPTLESFLGDRISFDFMEIHRAGTVSRLTRAPVPPEDHGQLVAAWYTHGEDQVYAEAPDLYVTRRWKVANGELVQLRPSGQTP